VREREGSTPVRGEREKGLYTREGREREMTLHSLEEREEGGGGISSGQVSAAASLRSRLCVL
jgi:hypothetical protein